MNMTLLHEITFYTMYAALALTIMVAVERMIFYGYTLRHARLLESSLTVDILAAPTLPEALTGRDSVPAETLRQMLG